MIVSTFEWFVTSTNHLLDLDFGIYMKKIKGTKKMFILKDDEILITINANSENLLKK